MNPANVVPYVLPPLFALVGTVIVGSGIRTIVGHRRFLRVAVRVPGVVTELREHHSSGSNTSRGSVTYHPVLRFTTLDGRLVETETDIGANPAPARVGARLSVLYDPADPTMARLAGLRGSGTLHGFLFVAVGSLFALIGYIGIAIVFT